MLKNYGQGRSQDGGGIGQGDHFLFYKFIEKNNRTVNKVYKTTSDLAADIRRPEKHPIVFEGR